MSAAASRRYGPVGVLRSARHVQPLGFAGPISVNSPEVQIVRQT